MHGLKLISAFALAGNDQALRRPESRPVIQECLKVDHYPSFGRRQVLQSILAGTSVVTTFPSLTGALDIDAFTNSELDKDTKNCNPKFDPKCAPIMTQDEALCKYGQSGNARGEACKRFKEAGGRLPTSTKEKSLGGAYAI